MPYRYEGVRNFLLDSGAACSFLLDTHTHTHTQEKNENLKLYFGDDTSAAADLSVDVSFKKIHTPNHLKEIAEKYNITGVLGADFLRTFNKVYIDFSKQKIKFGEFDVLQDKFDRIDIDPPTHTHKRDGLILTPASIHIHGHEITCVGVVDLGSPKTLLNTAAAERLNLPKNLIHTNTYQIRGVDGVTHTVDTIRDARIELGGTHTHTHTDTHTHTQTLVFTDTHIHIAKEPFAPSLKGYENNPIIVIGRDILAARGKLVFDFEHDELWMNTNETAGRSVEQETRSLQSLLRAKAIKFKDLQEQLRGNDIPTYDCTTPDDIIKRVAQLNVEGAEAVRKLFSDSRKTFEALKDRLTSSANEGCKNAHIYVSEVQKISKLMEAFDTDSERNRAIKAIQSELERRNVTHTDCYTNDDFVKRVAYAKVYAPKQKTDKKKTPNERPAELFPKSKMAQKKKQTQGSNPFSAFFGEDSPLENVFKDLFSGSAFGDMGESETYDMGNNRQLSVYRQTHTDPHTEDDGNTHGEEMGGLGDILRQFFGRHTHTDSALKFSTESEGIERDTDAHTHTHTDAHTHGDTHMATHTHKDVIKAYVEHDRQLNTLLMKAKAQTDDNKTMFLIKALQNGNLRSLLKSVLKDGYEKIVAKCEKENDMKCAYILKQIRQIGLI